MRIRCAKRRNAVQNAATIFNGGALNLLKSLVSTKEFELPARLTYGRAGRAV